MRKFSLFLATAAILFVWMSLPAFSQAPQPAGTTNPGQTGTAQQNVMKYTRGMTVASLAGKADSEMLELPSGRKITVGDARRLDAAMQKLRTAARGSKASPALKAKPAAGGTPIRTKSDLAAALKKPDGEVVQLPNGKTLTVAQLKLLQPLAEKRLGRKLDGGTTPPAPSGPAMNVNNRADLAAALKGADSQAIRLPSGKIVSVGQVKAARPEIEKRLGRSLDTALQGPALTGPAIKVSRTATKADIQNLLKQPDDTILESPNGKRTTVGALKKLIAQTNAAKKNVPANITPTSAPAPSPKAAAPAASQKATGR